MSIPSIHVAILALIATGIPGNEMISPMKLYIDPLLNASGSTNVVSIVISLLPSLILAWLLRISWDTTLKTTKFYFSWHGDSSDTSTIHTSNSKTKPTQRRAHSILTFPRFWLIFQRNFHLFVRLLPKKVFLHSKCPPFLLRVLLRGPGPLSPGYRGQGYKVTKAKCEWHRFGKAKFIQNKNTP